MAQAYEVQPEDREVLANVFFEELDIPTDGGYRVNTVEAALDLLRSAGIENEPYGYEDALYEEFDLKGDELFWQYVAHVFVEHGYDVYDGFEFFEVYAREDAS